MKSSHSRINLLEQEKVSKALLKLGIPTMIGMMVSALYNLVDVFFVGQLGTAQIGAVSIVYPLEMILLGIGLLFGAGASSFIARLLGIKAYDEASQCATTAIISAVLTGALLLLGITLFLNPILMALGATPTILPYAREYALIIIISMVFNVFNIAVNNIITAEGAAMQSMMAMLAGGVINMCLIPFLSSSSTAALKASPMRPWSPDWFRLASIVIIWPVAKACCVFSCRPSNHPGRYIRKFSKSAFQCWFFSCSTV